MFDKYRLIGAPYDALSKLYSGNAIHQCKIAMLRSDTINSETSILVAGAGQGQDAIHAAELGAKVTVVDISPTMLARFNKRLAAHPNASKLNIEQVQGDILKFEQFSQYDRVVVNFFLNVFERNKMTILLRHLVKLCRPGGECIIGDFCPSQGSLFNQSIQNIYWYAAATAFWLIAGNALHRIYDYRPLLAAEGLELEEERRFRFLGRELYYSLRVAKPVH